MGLIKELMMMTENKPYIQNIYSLDYNDSPNVSRNTFEEEDEFTICGKNLAIHNISDPDQGWFLKSNVGSATYKITDVSENHENKFTGIIPEALFTTGEYSLIKVWKDEDDLSHEYYYDKSLYIKNWQDSHNGISREDFWFSRGIKAGYDELSKALDAFLVERGFKKPEVRVITQAEAQKKKVVVVNHK